MVFELNDEVLKKAQKGDIKAFEKIIIQYEKLFFNIAYRMFHNQEDAKDATQEAILKIYRNIGKCTDLYSFKNWGCRIVTNTCIDMIRSRNRHPISSLDAEIEMDDGVMERQVQSMERSPEQQLVKKEAKKEIIDAIHQLDEKYKLMIVLRDINGLTYEEIAEVTELSLGTVKSRISRARNRLKDILLQVMEQNKSSNV